MFCPFPSQFLIKVVDFLWIPLSSMVFFALAFGSRYREGARAFRPLQSLNFYPNILHQSSIINHQSSIINHQPSTINHQPSIINHQSSTINRQPSTINHQSLHPALVDLTDVKFMIVACLKPFFHQTLIYERSLVQCLSIHLCAFHHQ